MNKELAYKILNLASEKPISPMNIAKQLDYSYEEVFNTIDQMEDRSLVYFNVEVDVLIVLE